MLLPIVLTIYGAGFLLNLAVAQVAISKADLDGLLIAAWSGAVIGSAAWPIVLAYNAIINTNRILKGNTE